MQNTLAKLQKFIVLPKLARSTQTLDNSHLAFQCFLYLLQIFANRFRLATHCSFAYGWHKLGENYPKFCRNQLERPGFLHKRIGTKEIPRTMHVFFRDYQISNDKCKKLNEKGLPTSCKESDENNATGPSVSVGIMFTLSWLMIYNI